jgi:ribosome-associated protein
MLADAGPEATGWNAGAMDGNVRAGAHLEIPAAELRWRFSRSSGAGGQGVNTTDSRVELRWSPEESGAVSAAQRDRLLSRLGDRLLDGELVVVASEHRAQLRNREAARLRLGALVEDALRPQRVRRPTRPTLGSTRRRLSAKSQQSERKAMRRRPDAD